MHQLLSHRQLELRSLGRTVRHSRSETSAPSFQPSRSAVTIPKVLRADTFYECVLDRMVAGGGPETRERMAVSPFKVRPGG
jgi:hypothetical protein